ncbi:MAG: hypothetical protein U0R26_06325 [Solirubrobacterales bacterium]
MLQKIRYPWTLMKNPCPPELAQVMPLVRLAQVTPPTREAAP